jgi:hypothetical protein
MVDKITRGRAIAYNVLKKKLKTITAERDRFDGLVTMWRDRALKAEAELEEFYVDDKGTAWRRPTAYAYAMACAALHRNRALYEITLTNLRELWLSLHMIREAVEQFVPVKASEYCLDSMQEADSICEGISLLATRRKGALVSAHGNKHPRKRAKRRT